MSPRIPPVQEPTAAVAQLLDETLVRDGRPLNIFTTLAYAPLLLRRVNALGGAFLAHGDLPARGSGSWSCCGSADDAELLVLADEACATATVSGPTWKRLAARWTSPQLVELVLLAGYYVMVSTFLNAVGVELEDGVPGWPDPSEEDSA